MKKKQTFFAKQFRKILLEKGFTQQELADKIGIEQAMISQWLIGFRNPSLASLKKIAAALDISFNYFIEDSSNKIEDKIENIDSKIKLILEINKNLEKRISFLEKELKELKNKK